MGVDRDDVYLLELFKPHIYDMIKMAIINKEK